MASKCVLYLNEKKKSLHTSQVAGGVRTIERLGMFLLSSGWDASPSQGDPSIKFASNHFYTWVERGIVRVKCLAEEHRAIRPRPWLERPLDPGSSALSMRPPRLAMRR